MTRQHNVAITKITDGQQLQEDLTPTPPPTPQQWEADWDTEMSVTTNYKVKIPIQTSYTMHV